MIQDPHVSPRRLFVRLSSLGDVVMATSALQALPGGENHWVVAREFAPLLENHPRIHRVWSFDRKGGWSQWKRMARQLWALSFDHVVDLHQSLRTRGLKLLFSLWSLKPGARPRPSWSTLSKQRPKLYGYFLWKRLWPGRLRPEPMITRYIRTAMPGSVAGTGPNAKPVGADLRHLLDPTRVPSEVAALIEQGNEVVCLMPGAAWEGKRWPVGSFAGLARETARDRANVVFVVLGSGSDQASRELVDELKTLQIPHLDGVGKWSLVEVANVLSCARLYLGNDTGLAHLAQAVGTRAWVLFGPTVPDMGFGPWLPGSRSFLASLWCQPCGKDGRYCFRPDRFACMKKLDSKSVAESLGEELSSAR